jgi:hypothetical protein
VGRAFSPLDEELALPPGELAPSVHEGLVRLATWVPSFAQAAREVYHFTGTTVSEATVRRRTEEAGAALVEVQAQHLQALEQALPEAAPGPAVQQLSVDGAMVPLVGGTWTEVKTLAVGEVRGQVVGEAVKAVEVSYFSRLADAATFTHLATVELARRGTETAGVVVALNDGAVWEQGFVDTHRLDAVRVLDFQHAAGYLTGAAEAVYGAGTLQARAWVTRQRHELRHGDPEQVLTALAALSAQTTSPTAAQVVQTSRHYLQERHEQIRYAEFELLGIPIGSGMVESANKLVVEARLKGAGMHWAARHVNPMLALRNLVCNDRWAEGWPAIVTRLRQRRQHASRDRRVARQAALALSVTAPPLASPPSAPLTSAPSPSATPSPPPPSLPTRRPAPTHPWRRPFSPNAPGPYRPLAS